MADGQPSHTLVSSRCSSPGKRRLNPQRSMSTFENIISSYSPIFESLILQLPTCSIISLYHTSGCLRQLLQDCPTAWKHLFFRTLNHRWTPKRQNPPVSDACGDSTTSSKPFSLDLLLLNIVLPFGTRLNFLELDNSAVAGESLASCILHPRRETLQHLSVRDCKQVSLKYHIVPFLTLFKLQKTTSGGAKPSGLALKSLYAFRCGHYRRRPYTPSSCVRADSDSAPTHDLIQLCHELGIWTDTAWCPTVGGRCFRRKDYSVSRSTPEANTEVWVAFDRLWRSGNRLGLSKRTDWYRSSILRGQLWGDADTWYNGELLGCAAEGKGVPAHLRYSHRTFVEDIKCHGCGTRILERCQQCSIQMHCVGCRRTFCQDCAFSRPLPRTTNLDRDTSEYFWWAPYAVRSPNRMLQEVTRDASFASDNIPNSTVSPPIKMQWCCIRPVFSSGGSITYREPVARCSSLNQLRAAPLPRGKGYEDPDFAQAQNDSDGALPAVGGGNPPKRQLQVDSEQTLQSLLQIPCSNGINPCSRNLCQDCWRVPTWKGACQACKEPFCLVHDIQGPNLRLCGFKPLNSEKISFQERFEGWYIMTNWEETVKLDRIPRDEAEDSFRRYLKTRRLKSNILSILEAIIPSVKWPLATGDALRKEVDALISRRFRGHSNFVALPPEPSDQDTTGLARTSIGTDHLRDTGLKNWKGCGYFLCPDPRVSGDHRPQCTAAVRQCIICTTYVCPDCLILNPPCDCSYCKDHYICPNCIHDSKQGCKKEEEEADQVAMMAGEFMLAVDDVSSNI